MEVGLGHDAITRSLSIGAYSCTCKLGLSKLVTDSTTATASMTSRPAGEARGADRSLDKSFIFMCGVYGHRRGRKRDRIT